MKRHGQLFDKFTSFANLLEAYYKARRGASGKKGTQMFTFHLEQELFTIQQELKEGLYIPRPYRYFKIYDPKERTISVADFRDRVVHHALINVLEPIYEPCFIFDSYATRKDKGTHKAIARAQTFLRHNDWFWKSDIDKYFDSIQHDVLLTLLSRKIKDRPLLNVAERIIRNGGQNGVGLPIGNLTSQFLANVYLNGFDHFIKERLGMKCYLRYMDDFVLFHQDKNHLKLCRQEIKDYLENALGLSVKENASFLNSSRHGLTFLGRRIFPEIVRIARPNARRMLKRLNHQHREYQTGQLSEEKYLQSLSSYSAHLEPYSGFRSAYFC